MIVIIIIINKIKFTISLLVTFLFHAYEHLWALAKICGKLISRKIILGEATQLKSRYLYKANKSQLAWHCLINLKFHENEISESLAKISFLSK